MSALSRHLLDSLTCPRCEGVGFIVCGEARRRIVGVKTAEDGRTALARHIRERREALGMSIKELAAHFPSASGGITGCVWNWENNANVPTPEQWPILKSLLGLSDEFEDMLIGERRWTESTVTYLADGKALAAHEKRDDYGRGGLGLPDGTFKATRVAPDAWTDCGHDNYRPGVVFDPFAGSGTTLLAAALAGRDAIGIDLDESNLDLMRQRIGEQVLIVSERVEGDTVTWTVNRHMPGTKGESDGQQSLFSEEAS